MAVTIWQHFTARRLSQTIFLTGSGSKHVWQSIQRQAVHIWFSSCSTCKQFKRKKHEMRDIIRSQIYLLGYVGEKSALNSWTRKVTSCSGSRFCRSFKAIALNAYFSFWFLIFTPVTEYSLLIVRSPASSVMTQTAFSPLQAYFTIQSRLFTQWTSTATAWWQGNDLRQSKAERRHETVNPSQDTSSTPGSAPGTETRLT